MENHSFFSSEYINQHIETFINCFQTRRDVYALQQESGQYLPEHKSLKKDIYVAHLRGEITIGAYLVTPPEDCTLLVIDIDTKSPGALQSVCDSLMQHGIKSNQLLKEYSGGKGYHVWIRVDETCPAGVLRKLGRIISKESGVKEIEVFPKQDRVPMKKYGNLIKLPCGIHRKHNVRTFFTENGTEPIDDWGKSLNSWKGVSKRVVVDIVESCGRLLERKPKMRKMDKITKFFSDNFKRDLPCFQRILSKGVIAGKRNNITLHTAAYLKKQGLSKEDIITVLVEWNEQKNEQPNGDAFTAENIIKRIEYVFENEYGDFGCLSPDMSDYCHDDCPIKQGVNTEQRKNSIDAQINVIPADTKKTDLPRVLEPVLREIAHLNKVEIDAFLDYTIKNRFGLRQKDLDGYRQMITGFQYEQTPDAIRQLSGQVSKYTAIFDQCVDVVAEGDKPMFLVKQGGVLKLVDHTIHEGMRKYPPPKNKIPFLLVNGDSVISFYDLVEPFEIKYKKVFYEVVDYLRDVSELPSDSYYVLLAAWVFHTYTIDFPDVEYSPIIGFFAEPERGKSRTGKGLIYISFRGMHIESLREAYIIRMATYYNASIFLDVMDLVRKLEKTNSMDILLSRFEKGIDFGRVLNPSLGPHEDINVYKVFGPTIYATNESVNHILETRAITLTMPVSIRRFEKDIKKIHGIPLREKLLAFRAEMMGKKFPDIQKPSSGRLGDILKPLAQIIQLVAPQEMHVFKDLVAELKQRKQMDYVNSFESEIIKAMVQLKDNVVGGVLHAKLLRDVINADKNMMFEYSPQKIGRKLKSLGFDPAKWADGSAATIYNVQLVRILARKYGVDIPQEFSETSEMQESSEEVSDISEVSEDSSDGDITT